ncbi:AMP-binding protein [Novosphingobium malaysiense]|uniref:AMP-binding protein n=1 Tax=Novosphingobium malaysiense TaxID=1348853 RepID=UPI00068BF57C|nr:AMP-binding protein [Novosphingobium malaysiense]
MTSFHDLLRTSAERHVDRPAIRFDDQVMSYAQLLSRAEAFASGFATRGIAADCRLALIMDNSLECILVWLASTLTGCTDIPINPQYRGDLLQYLLEDSEATAVVCDAHYLSGLLEVAPRLPGLKQIIVNGDLLDTPRSRLPVNSLADCESGTQFEGPSSAGERVILYTSGTTGPSKGVIHTQRSMLNLARYNASVLDYRTEDRLLNFFPLFHQNARYTGVVPALCAGASIRIERKLSTSRFWEICNRDGVTAFNYLGSVLRMILNATDPDLRKGMHTVNRAFGAGAPPAAWSEFEDRLGIRLFETYGLSEAPMATINIPGPDRCPVGSAGRASDLFEVRVFDEADNDLPAGETGEFVLRPRRPDIFMLGYHNKAEATVAALQNLWFHTGDRGYLSSQGHLYFEERSKDSIRRRGENISAWEVESVIEKHPAVAEAAVYGLAAADNEEDVAASIVCSDREADLEAIHSFASKRLPGYAVPTLMRVVDDLPRTPTAKVKKDELRALPRDAYTAFRLGSPPEGLDACTASSPILHTERKRNEAEQR